MKRWFLISILGFGLTTAGSVGWAASSEASVYELYSWKTGNEWTYALLPMTKNSRIDAEITQAGKLRGASKLKEKFLGMKEGDVIVWKVRTERGMVYPADVIVQDFTDYAQTVGVKLVSEDPAHATK